MISFSAWISSGYSCTWPCNNYSSRFCLWWLIRDSNYRTGILLCDWYNTTHICGCDMYIYILQWVCICVWVCVFIYIYICFHVCMSDVVYLNSDPWSSWFQMAPNSFLIRPSKFPHLSLHMYSYADTWIVVMLWHLCSGKTRIVLGQTNRTCEC